MSNGYEGRASLDLHFLPNQVQNDGVLWAYYPFLFIKKIRIVVLLVSVYASEEMKMRDTGPILLLFISDKEGMAIAMAGRKDREDDVQEKMTKKRSQIAMVLLLLY